MSGAEVGGMDLVGGNVGKGGGLSGIERGHDGKGSGMCDGGGMDLAGRHVGKGGGCRDSELINTQVGQHKYIYRSLQKITDDKDSDLINTHAGQLVHIYHNIQKIVMWAMASPIIDSRMLALAVYTLNAKFLGLVFAVPRADNVMYDEVGVDYASNQD